MTRSNSTARRAISVVLLARTAVAAIAREATESALDAITPVLQNELEAYTRSTVRRVLQSEGFAATWAAVNLAFHAQLLTALREGSGSAFSSSDGTLAVDLGPVFDDVRAALVASGYAAAAAIPSPEVSLVVVQSPHLVTIERAVNVIDETSAWLPWAALALAVAAVVVAPSRRRAVAGIGWSIAGGMLLLILAAEWGRHQYLAQLQSGTLMAAAAGSSSTGCSSTRSRPRPASCWDSGRWPFSRSGRRPWSAVSDGRLGPARLPGVPLARTGTRL